MNRLNGIAHPFIQSLCVSSPFRFGTLTLSLKRRECESSTGWKETNSKLNYMHTPDACVFESEAEAEAEAMR